MDTIDLTFDSIHISISSKYLYLYIGLKILWRKRRRHVNKAEEPHILWLLIVYMRVNFADGHHNAFSSSRVVNYLMALDN